MARVAVALVAVVALCGWTGVDRTTFDDDDHEPFALWYLTRDADDTYELRQRPGAVRVSAPADNVGHPQGSDTRALVWSPEVPASVDQEVCASWTDATDWAQQGLALRIRPDEGGMRSLIVAKNTVYGAEWQLNVYSWDTARRTPLQIHGAVALDHTMAFFQRPIPLPWTVCARTFRTLVWVKAWPSAEPEPRWSDAEHAGVVNVGEDWVYAGRPGWYAGHVEPGGSLGMHGLSARASATGSED